MHVIPLLSECKKVLRTHPVEPMRVRLLQGVISIKTLTELDRMRKGGVKLVLITGQTCLHLTQIANVHMLMHVPSASLLMQSPMPALLCHRLPELDGHIVIAPILCRVVVKLDQYSKPSL